ncbi:MAG: bifunctional demethylmenaquinone methyltransferase/2-methoxy-6-polyprenyl-1,4-benzoquinol methylase UbiE [Phycisphaerales bacterium]
MPASPSNTPTASPAPPAPPAWTGETLATDPHARQDKAERVRRMFAAIAGSYDLNNRVHSLGLDQRWRAFAVRQAAVRAGDHVLDVACGTGDLSRAFARAHPAPARVVGLDFTREMLDIARARQVRDAARAPVATNGSDATCGPIEYIEGDAMKLPFPDASFDIVSIAFGIRNVQDPAVALAEFFRVLRPGGRLVVLEFDTPRVPIVGWLARLYTNRIMPITATLISGDRSGAYRYLPKSVESFLDREQLGAAISGVGFANLRQHALTFGQCVCSAALKP